MNAHLHRPTASTRLISARHGEFFAFRFSHVSLCLLLGLGALAASPNAFG
jgi:hypothetical protein